MTKLDYNISGYGQQLWGNPGIYSSGGFHGCELAGRQSTIKNRPPKYWCGSGTSPKYTPGWWLSMVELPSENI